LPSKGKGHDWTNDDGIGKRFPRRVEHAFDVTIQRSHHTYSGEHRWPVKRASGRAGHKSAGAVEAERVSAEQSKEADAHDARRLANA